jgi:RNA polymerase sigma-70 factor (ECF subfamily)
MGMGRDEQLVKDIQRRKDGVLDTLYNSYAPVLLSICLRYCGNLQDAEDVLHDGFIKILKHIHGFKTMSSGSFEGWMKRIMVNTALNYLRDRNKNRQLLDIDPLRDRIQEEEEDPASWGDLQEQISKEEIMRMICELPPGYRAVFNLYVFEEYSHKEISEQLLCSENTSKSQLSKARRLLRKMISEVIEKQKVIK